MTRRMVVALTMGCAATVVAGAFFASHLSQERQAQKEKASAELHSLERKCVGVRYRLSQRQTIDLTGRRSDQDFIDQRCAPAHL